MLELDPTIEDKILNAIKIGAPVETAAAFAGISYDTVRMWVIKAKEDPESPHAAFLAKLHKALSEYEMRDISVLDAHAMGRPAKFLMKPVVDHEGKVIFESPGKPLMEPVLNSEGNPVIQQSEIKSDWRAAMERLSRRIPRSWRRQDSLNVNMITDPVLTFDNKAPETKEAVSFEQRVAIAMQKLEEDV